MAKIKKRVRKPKVKNGGEAMSPEEMYDRALVLAKRGRKRHAEEVIPLLRAASDSGHSMAAHALASWYIHGIGVRKNYAVAAELEKKAARSGIVDAICNLAFAYETGKGVEKDQKKSYRLYRRAASLGDADATYEVGRCLFYGIGIRRNERLGHEWIEKSKGMERKTADKSQRTRPA